MSKIRANKKPKLSNIIKDSLPNPSGNLRTKFPIPQEEIEEVRKRREEKLVFSFRFFDGKHEAFNLGGVQVNWYLDLFGILQEVSDITRNELVVVQKQHYDAHDHDWDKLDYKYNLDGKFLEQSECLQFRISQSKGRVHGFIIGNVFYIVWLDPHHNLYPDEKFGGRKFYDRPLTMFELLQVENEDLKKETETLLDELTKPSSA